MWSILHEFVGSRKRPALCGLASTTHSKHEYLVNWMLSVIWIHRQLCLKLHAARVIPWILCSILCAMGAMGNEETDPHQDQSTDKEEEEGKGGTMNFVFGIVFTFIIALSYWWRMRRRRMQSPPWQREREWPKLKPEPELKLEPWPTQYAYYQYLTRVHALFEFTLYWSPTFYLSSALFSSSRCMRAGLQRSHLQKTRWIEFHTLLEFSLCSSCQRIH